MSKKPRRSTIDAPAPGHEAFHPPTPSQLPTVPALLPPPVDELPAASACRWCGKRTNSPNRFGGVIRLDPAGLDHMPADATDKRQVRVLVGPDPVYDPTGSRIAPSYTVVQQFTVALWRFCDDCEHLANDEQPITLLRAALHGPSLPADPTHLAVAADHAPTPFYQLAGSTPFAHGSSDSWEHITSTAIEVSRSAIGTLIANGGAPHPSGKPCGVCGRTNSPYGWREEMWRPPGTNSETPTRVPICGGTRNVHNPQAPPWMRWRKEPVGCEVLVDAPRNGLSSPLEEIVWRSAKNCDAQLPSWTVHHLADKRRVMAWKHPGYTTVTDVRGPWWHVVDAPLVPPSVEDQLAERLARLEAELAVKGVSA